MDKIELGTPDITQENISKLIELFPQVATEVESDGELKQAVDFDALKELLGDVAEGQRERYRLSWPGKRAAKNEAFSTDNLTLRPVIEKSMYWNQTGNIYIEGDNLDALKLLRDTYSGRINMIYIDPPYNTGNNLIYKNNFHVSQNEATSHSGDYDECGRHMVTNPHTNGRFHSDWLSMMYSRLLLSRDLLKEDGVLVCAIDDNEVSTLILMLKEVFGESSYDVVPVTVVHNPRGVQGTNFSSIHEYAIFVFPKRMKVIADRKIDEEDVSWSQFRNWGSESLRTDARNCFYPVFVKDGNIVGFGDVLPPDDHPSQSVTLSDGTVAVYPIDRSGIERKWRYARQSVEDISNMLRARETSSGYEIEIGKTFGIQRTVWSEKRYDANEYGTKIVNSLVPDGGFTFPKSLWTVYDALYAGTANNKDALILDFFSGSGTTAHAVMELNKADGGNRHFILVQIPESIPANVKSRFSNICEIGEARIKAAGNQYLCTNSEKATEDLCFDVGFRVLRVDSSCFSDVCFEPNNTDQQSLLGLVDNVKEGRTDLDLLFEVLPKFRIPYSAPIEERDLAGKKCFIVDGNQLIACFDTEVSTDTIEEIAKMRPLYAVLRDASMADDATAANFEELFKTYSPDTVRKVI